MNIPLTEPERALLVALTTTQYSGQEQLAEHLCCHLNTIKYRARSITRKWGLPPTTNFYALTREAFQRGYGIDFSELLYEFVAEAAPGGSEPFEFAKAHWLREAADRFLASRLKSEVAA